MSSNNNIRSEHNKDYYRTCDTTDDIVEQRRCRECYKTIIAGLNLRTNKVTTYEIDGYPNQLVEHPHHADIVTRTDLQHRIAIEFRHIQKPNRDDRRYLMDDRRRVMI